MQRAADRSATTTIRHLLPRPDFRRLLATRLLAQFGDGVFQAALAGTVLFNPQRAADPSTSPPASPSCCCRTRWSGRSPGCGWTAGAAARCCCAPTWCGPGWSPSWRPSCWAASTAPLLRGGAGGLLGEPVRPGRAVGRAAAHHRRAVPGLGQRAVDDVGVGGHGGRRRCRARAAAARGAGDAGYAGGDPGGRAALPRGRRRRRRLRPRVPRPRPHARPAVRARVAAAWSPAPGTRGAPAGRAALPAIGLHRLGYGCSP